MRARGAAHRHRRGRTRNRRSDALAGRVLGQGDRATRRLRPRRAGPPRAPHRGGLPPKRGRAGGCSRRAPAEARGRHRSQERRRNRADDRAGRRDAGRGRVLRRTLRRLVRHARRGRRVGALPHVLGHRRHGRRRKGAPRLRVAAGELGGRGASARHRRGARDEGTRRLPSGRPRRHRPARDGRGNGPARPAAPRGLRARARRPRRHRRAQSGRRRGHHGRPERQASARRRGLRHPRPRIRAERRPHRHGRGRLRHDRRPARKRPSRRAALRHLPRAGGPLHDARRLRTGRGVPRHRGRKRAHVRLHGGGRDGHRRAHRQEGRRDGAARERAHDLPHPRRAQTAPRLPGGRGRPHRQRVRHRRRGRLHAARQAQRRRHVLRARNLPASRLRAERRACGVLPGRPRRGGHRRSGRGRPPSNRAHRGAQGRCRHGRAHRPAGHRLGSARRPGRRDG